MKKFYSWYKKHITAAIFTGLILGIITGLFLANRFEPVLTDAGDTHDNGTEDQWKDHHVQGIHVNASDKACDGKNWFETVCQKTAGNIVIHTLL